MTSTAESSDLYTARELLFCQTGIYQDEQMRPYVIFNMIASVDGRGAVNCASATDRRVMAQLRANVDAVVWGGGTIRRDPIALRLPPDLEHRTPLAVIWTRSGHLPAEHPLWQNERSERLIFTMTATRELQDIPAEIRQVDSLLQMFFVLWRDYQVRTVLVEGGPTFNSLLLSESIGEEIFLTLAPVLKGDDTPAILQTGLTSYLQLHCHSVKQVKDEIYLRYWIGGLCVESLPRRQ